MSISFEGDLGDCMCYNCFYGFNILKWEDLKIYEDEGVDIKDGLKITPSVIDRIFVVCHKTFRSQYNLEPQSLQNLCMEKIVKERNLNIGLLTRRLAERCKRF